MKAQLQRSFLNDMQKSCHNLRDENNAGCSSNNKIEFVFLDGPIQTEDEELVPEIVRSWFGPQKNGYREWWNRNVKTGEYSGWWPDTLNYIVDVLIDQEKKKQPIHGLCGFSQGGFVSCYLVAIARLLEIKRNRNSRSSIECFGFEISPDQEDVLDQVNNMNSDVDVTETLRIATQNLILLSSGFPMETVGDTCFALKPYFSCVAENKFKSNGCDWNMTDADRTLRESEFWKNMTTKTNALCVGSIDDTSVPLATTELSAIFFKNSCKIAAQKGGHKPQTSREIGEESVEAADKWFERVIGS